MRNISGLAAILLLSAPAEAAIELRLADTLPTGHVYREVLSRPFIEGIQQRTNNEVKILDFPAGQLGQQRDYLALTTAGVADIGYIVPAAISNKFPLSTVTELPGIIANSCEGALTMWALVRPGGILYEEEYKANGVRPVALIVAEPYQLLLNTKRPVQGLRELVGMKIRSTGAALQQFVRDLQAVPVNVATPDVYEAMSRGTIDGAILGFQAVAGYDLAGHLQSMTVGERLGSSYVTYVMAEDRWQKLPQNVRTAIEESGETATRSACGALTKAEKTFSDRLRDRVKAVSFTAAEQEKLQEISTATLKAWAADLDKRGRPGSKVLQVYEDEKKKHVR